MSTVRSRFAPSPTGYLHIGSLRSALYEYAYPKSLGGKFILRIEDTDQTRFVPGATEKLIDTLKLFGLNWDEGPIIGGPYAPYIQSERVTSGIYKKYAEQLVAQNNAYYCFCKAQTTEEIKESHSQKELILRDPCRDLLASEVKNHLDHGDKPAIRLRLPENEIVTYHDFVINKDISWNTNDVDEVMLLKSDGFPTYQLAVVVDDAIMQISHIIRAHEWLPSTPVHVLLFRYLNFPLPEIGHVTDILDPEGGKLSKRKRNVSCEDYLAQGYLPEAILNYIMLCGWAPKDNREIYSLDEFVANFQKGDLQTSNAMFNPVKLDWFNGYYIRQKSDKELVDLLKPFVPLTGSDPVSKLEQIVPLIKDRLVKLSDFTSFAGFFFNRPKVDLSLFGNLDYKKHLKGALSNLSNLPAEEAGWSNEEIQNSLNSLITQNGWKTGDFYMSLRIALTGSKFTPPITESATILGRDETLLRLQAVLP